MALFKIFKGKKANLPETRVDGYAYFTTDDGKFYIDHAGQGENLANRTCINPTMIGATEETAGKEGMVPAAGIEDKNKFLKGDGTWSESPQELRNLVDGSATGSVRGTYTKSESNDYTIGTYAFAEGYYTTASEQYSHAEGENTTASGPASHAEGGSTTASNNCSHAEGGGTTASGLHSHAEGSGTTASGHNSHAEGSDTIAQRYSQTVAGTYNIADTYGTNEGSKGQYIEIIGNGNDRNNRSNARTLDWSGNEWLAGKLTIGATGTNSMDVATVGQLNSYIPLSQKGSVSGVAELDSSGKILSSQLPSYVDDVEEYSSFFSFPTTGLSGKIYIALDTNLAYRWSGSDYVEISPSLALGLTSSTAYRGDRGKIAYDHANAKGNAFNNGFYKITTNTEGHVIAATAVQKNDITALGVLPDLTTVAEIVAGTITDNRIVSPKVLHDAIAQMIENAGLLKV